MPSKAPRVADASADPQRAAVYYAEEVAAESMGGLPDVPMGEVVEFVRAAMVATGWTGWGDECAVPAFAFDVADDDWHSGWHEAATGVIHLHARLLGPVTILHELAHWLRPRDGHGPQFCGVYVSLVRAGVGPEAAAELHAALVDAGADVDKSWCD